MKFSFYGWITALLFTIIPLALNAQFQVQFSVNGACGMCADRIESTAMSYADVVAVAYDLETQILTTEVSDEYFSAQNLAFHIAQSGHDTEYFKAPDQVYAELPGCCQYREFATSETPEKDGVVYGQIFTKVEGKRKKEPMVGVNVFWQGTNKGSTTDDRGFFEIRRTETTNTLVASMIGFGEQTIDFENRHFAEILLNEGVDLTTVEVVYREKSARFDPSNPIATLKIDAKELTKAACCSLSESFETTPSVDVSFADAVTGTRQIHLLGLAGPYVQITQELIPNIRGLAATQGMAFLPGPWIESIQLSKGTGSVSNGFESMTGQINVELKKPDTERLFVNLFANEMGRLEGNINAGTQVTDKWSTAVLLHGSTMQNEHDFNDDSFIDNPVRDLLVGMNRWKYVNNETGLMGQIGVKGIRANQRSGQGGHNHDEHDHTNSTEYWVSELNTRRLEAFAKLGYVFKFREATSFGSQYGFSTSEIDSYFGQRTYRAEEQSGYVNLMFQSYLGNTAHTYKTGLSYQYDQVGESMTEQTFNRTEHVPGAFFEYTNMIREDLTVVAGLRGDFHNNYGFFTTPRLHVRYAPLPTGAFRFTAGRGARTASILSENLKGLASARQFVVQQGNSDLPYGLEQERSWNFGGSFTNEWQVRGRGFVLALDAYHTRFENQIVIDYDASPQTVQFYNLDGSSFSNSLQAQIDYEVFTRFDARVAYRFNDVQVDFQDQRREQALIARHRAFVNLAYETPNQWVFDATVNWTGSKRLPITSSSLPEFQLDERSPDFTTVHAQISKRWTDRWDVYLGVENAFDLRQENPIVNSENPFSDTFDGSMIWGPIVGRNVYVGMRFVLK